MDLLDGMAAYVRVVEAGSLAAAARSLKRSVPALSRQLQALEAELGVALIVRNTRRHRVTEAGQRWYQHCTRLLGDLASARRTLQPGSVEGRLVVSASFTLGLHCVVPVLPRLLERHPKLEVELRLEDRLVDLVADGVDVVVRSGAPIAPSASLVARPLLSFRRVVVAAPTYLSGAPTLEAPDDLREHVCLVQLGGQGPLRTWTFERGGDQRAVTVGSRLAMTAPLAVKAAALAGAGVAWLPEWLVAEALREGRLVQLLQDWTSAELTTWAVYRVELKGAPGVKAFLQAVSGRLKV